MMKKPMPKVEVAIRTISPISGFITFYATPDAASEFAEFGKLEKVNELYWLWIDGRYDFDEVVAYIKAYNN